MEEYEYNFKVEDIKPYIKYCEDNNYKNEGIFKQERIVYENKYNSKLLARITTNDNKETIFDLKNVSQNDNTLKVSQESLPIKVTKENEEQIKSIINTLEFIKVSVINRTRHIYSKDGVTFEIDDYTNPKMKVIAIEGQRDKVDKIYKELKGENNE